MHFACLGVDLTPLALYFVCLGVDLSLLAVHFGRLGVNLPPLAVYFACLVVDRRTATSLFLDYLDKNWKIFLSTV